MRANCCPISSKLEFASASGLEGWKHLRNGLISRKHPGLLGVQWGDTWPGAFWRPFWGGLGCHDGRDGSNVVLQGKAETAAIIRLTKGQEECVWKASFSM